MKNVDKIISRLTEQKQEPLITELDQSRVLKSDMAEFIFHQGVFVHKDELDTYVTDFKQAKKEDDYLMAVDIYLKKAGTSLTLTPTYLMWQKDMKKFVSLFTKYAESTGLDWDVGKGVMQVDRKYFEAVRNFTELLKKKSNLIFAKDYGSGRTKDYWLWSGSTFKV